MSEQPKRKNMVIGVDPETRIVTYAAWIERGDAAELSERIANARDGGRRLVYVVGPDSTVRIGDSFDVRADRVIQLQHERDAAERALRLERGAPEPGDLPEGWEPRSKVIGMARYANPAARAYVYDGWSWSIPLKNGHATTAAEAIDAADAALAGAAAPASATEPGAGDAQPPQGDADAIQWQGDLDDDCHAEWHGMRAHAEAMTDDQWYCQVYRPGERDCLFHSNQDDIKPLTGRAARALCEYVMRAHAPAQPPRESPAPSRGLAQQAAALTILANAVGRVVRDTMHNDLPTMQHVDLLRDAYRQAVQVRAQTTKEQTHE